MHWQSLDPASDPSIAHGVRDIGERIPLKWRKGQGVSEDL